MVDGKNSESSDYWRTHLATPRRVCTRREPCPFGYFEVPYAGIDPCSS